MSVYERISTALSSLGKRRDRDDGSTTPGRERGSTPAGTPGSQAPAKKFRPWEQSDLHRRLESYKPLTWFAKPDCVGPIPCALKGWVNQGCDVLSCDHCGAKLVYPPNVSYSQRQAAADMFVPSLTTKHGASCPWRQTHCNETLLVYVPEHSNNELVQVFKNLQGKLLRVDVLPDLDLVSVHALRAAGSVYGSLDQLVLGLAQQGGAAGKPGSGALAPRGRGAPSSSGARIWEEGEEEPPGSGGSFSAAAAAAAATATAGAGADADGHPALLLQPSRLTAQQKASLLALLGWDLEVLQPDSAGGAVAAPYGSTAGYSLSHLGIKAKGGPAGGKAAGEARSDKVPMSQVVLKCPHCNGRMGLWNFAGVRPVPAGRLTPATSAASASAGLPRPAAVGAGAPLPAGIPPSPSGRLGFAGNGTQIHLPASSFGTPYGGSYGGAVPASPGAGANHLLGLPAGPAADPLSMTIAGGSFAAGAGQPLRPFGSGAASAPAFGFGAASAAPAFGTAASSEPVFGTAALDADAARRAASLSVGGSGGGVPLATAGSVGAGASGRAAAGGSILGQKRKAEASVGGSSVPLPGMGGGGGDAVMADAPTPVADSKRVKLASGSASSSAFATHGAAAAALPPTPPGSATRGSVLGPGGAAAGSCSGGPGLKHLDPAGQHRSWCPWVYQGGGDSKHMSGWQHMLSALGAEQQALARQAAAAAGPGCAAAGPGGASAPGDAKQLRDQVMHNIRSL